MKLTTIDFESYWDNEHTLKKMSPMAYVMSPKTEIISVSLQVDDGPILTEFGESDVRALLADVDWERTFAIGHNMAGFDALILAWRFGISPRMWGCTRAMARPVYAKRCELSLAKLSEFLKLGIKDSTALVNTKGKRLADFTEAERQAMKVYNADDVRLCRLLFEHLLPHFSSSELWHIDAKIRAFVEPQLHLDVGLLSQALVAEREAKRAALIKAGEIIAENAFDEAVFQSMGEEDLAEALRAELASAPKFGKMLQRLNIPVPMKPSPTNPERMVPALAKSDDAFLALQNHENEAVAAAARARLSVKSTIVETRLQAFIDAAAESGGRWPVTTHYCGADTTGRASGWHYNPLNLPRVSASKSKPADALRRSIVAPAGHKVVVCDKSGIELRVNHFLWKVPSSMELYAQDPQADLYRAFAAARHGIRPEEVDKNQRQLAKVCIAEGELVLTHNGLKPIESVSVLDLVWDGVEWVTHDGPMFMGTKEVMTYDGLTATPDHVVWVEDGRSMPLAEAAAGYFKLARTGAGGIPLGFSRADRPGVRPEGGSQVRVSSLRRLREAEVSVLRQFAGWQDAGVPVVQPEVRGADVAVAAAGSGEAAMHQPERRWVRALRRAWDHVRVRVRRFRSGVGDGEPGAGAVEGAGPDQEQRGVQAGQPAVGQSAAQHGEPPRVSQRQVPPVPGAAPGGSVRGQHPTADAVFRHDVRADCGAMASAERQAQRRVWDILNAGPRHRFTVSGRLVSNCQLGLGFGAGWRTFQKVAKLMSGGTIDLNDDEAEQIVRDWRREYAEIAQGWKTCHSMLPHIHARTDGLPIDDWGLVKTHREGLLLPSGRLIRYPGLHEEDGTDGKREWWYGTGRHRARIYAGKITENIVQALARDCVYDDALEVYRRTGYRYSLEVYDELVYVVPDKEAEDFLKVLVEVMSTPPKWWSELVLHAEGDIAERYGDAK